MDASLGKWLMDAYSIGLTEYRALEHLAQAADKELRVNDLAQRVGLNQSSVTRLVSRLEAKDLARRDLCPDDRRGVYAVITEQGETLVRQVRDSYEERVHELLGAVAAHYPQLDASQVGRALAGIGNLVSP
ncbi:MarR family transcriptional regulator [Micromonospora sp. C28SCA-DRY-2]|uniref:MarR family winged helix-turn-helix transcriptional regulator n=1 Tax=Micromonospora sp. C28SCA-DRY-2 TaxID=3059522 RepID=UPI002674A8CA|nr:MarR family transcriptional regulator [Micromonospora sp. C28SCA-DRY-2]MDO3703401.1 MarR family transcriptional regulator [Micromonospora sp. C28SCA-DRY-2]